VWIKAESSHRSADVIHQTGPGGDQALQIVASGGIGRASKEGAKVLLAAFGRKPKTKVGGCAGSGSRLGRHGIIGDIGGGSLVNPVVQHLLKDRLIDRFGGDPRRVEVSRADILILEDIISRCIAWPAKGQRAR
jgi:hypothetical protein